MTSGRRRLRIALFLAVGLGATGLWLVAYGTSVFADLDLDIASEMLWGPLRTRWLQRDGPLTPAFTDAVVETALNGLRPR